MNKGAWWATIHSVAKSQLWLSLHVDKVLLNAAPNMSASLENSADTTGLEKFSFHSNPKEEQCQGMFKLPFNCTYFTCCYQDMLKILQAKLQQYMHQEIPDIQAELWRGRGTKDHIANIPWIMEKAKELQINSYVCFLDRGVGQAMVCGAARSQTGLSDREHPGGTVVKNPPTSAGDTGSWKSPGVGNGSQVQYFWLENPMDRGTGQATVYGVTKNRT